MHMHNPVVTEFSDYPEFPQDWPIEHSKSPDQGIYTPGPLGELQFCESPRKWETSDCYLDPLVNEFPDQCGF